MNKLTGKTLIIVWGVAKNDQPWQEQVLASDCKNFADIQKVKEIASKHGFHSFRILVYNDEILPDFTKTINL